MKGPNDPASPTERRVRRVITAAVGQDSVHWVDPVFAIANLCLREAARCYDDGDYLASCVMSRGALEAAFYGFLYTKKSTLGPGDTRPAFMLLKPPWGRTRRVRQKFDDLYGMVKDRVVLSKNTQKAVRRIKSDGDLSAHLAERYTESTWRAIKRSEDELQKPRELRRRVRGRWSWPTATMARGRLADVSRVVGRLAMEKLRETPGNGAGEDR